MSARSRFAPGRSRRFARVARRATGRIVVSGATLPAEAVNTLGVSIAARDAIICGARDLPRFDHDLRLTRRLAELENSAENGTRRAADGRPLVPSHQVRPKHAGS